MGTANPGSWITVGFFICSENPSFIFPFISFLLKTCLVHKALKFIHALLSGVQLWVSPVWSQLLRHRRRTLALRSAAGAHQKQLRVSVLYLVVRRGAWSRTAHFSTPGKHSLPGSREDATGSNVPVALPRCSICPQAARWSPSLLHCLCTQTLGTMDCWSQSSLWPCWWEIQAIHLLPKFTATASCRDNWNAPRTVLGDEQL